VVAIPRPAVEHAVRTILNQVAIEDAVLGEIRERSRLEGFPLPDEVVERIHYLFVEG
jgi:hypothetical protein